MSDEAKYSLQTFARDAARVHCCRSNPNARRSPTVNLGDLTVAAWPLSTETVAALVATYPKRVPAKDVTIHNYHFFRGDFFVDSTILGALDPAPDDSNYFSMAYKPTLAHFAIDLTGDASTLTPTTRPPPHTFATVVYFFPSTCVGGAVTISDDDWTTTFEALDGCFLSFYSTCNVTVAPITSGHRSIAVYYAAYDLGESGWHDTVPKAWFAPRPLPSIQELQDVACHYDHEGSIGVAIGLETRSSTFDSLNGRDKAIVDRLLAADVFDIALVRTGDDDKKHTDANAALPETFHPLCGTPALVQEIYEQTPISEFAADTDEFEAPGCFLLVWPKAARVHILGYNRLIALLRANMDVDVLGFGSLHSVLTAAFRYFYPRPRDNDGRGSSLDGSGFQLQEPESPGPDRITSKMASLLYEHGDLRLIETFLDVHNQWADDETMANWIVAVLRRFGASIFQHRLQTANVSRSFVAQVVHLATAGDVVAQSIASDCIRLWWPRLMSNLLRKTVRDAPMQVCRMFDIETYMLTHPMDLTASMYLRRYLPEALVRKVAAYLVAPPVSLADALRGSAHLAGYLPAVIWPHRNALSHARAASCIEVATEYLCAPGGHIHFSTGHAPSLVYLALLTAGTPAFAKVDAAVQKLRRYAVFTSECAGLDTASLSTMEALVLNEYMQPKQPPT
ncbi:hypothetical protein SPRG_13101 [Saprolegnia parasitica CBS 223.65]|uniref:Uncharacterized protein n=1 Tax=Saprolegnia parasitica (strain CBS 223.65) TaxID=695850 RepID=A0A067BTQ4_SAPPC|nr:hypothetical protein SPRG_13101 [Saprolegnia parasitica CBS 223.65]KDO21919.1 hypothetical protein SPRG_13101 [Saprolegnia parasitica CBS 223.65]|eukprot:XP_012207361.1 hypothetical protein SPRG_13101 [Saprolegnia parasitica CBS 223.65]